MMKPGYGLELSLSQRLALTPELRQAILVLQMGVLELNEFINHEIVENPLLEIASDPQEEFLPESPDPADEELLAYLCDSSDLGPYVLSGGSPKDRPPLFETFAEDHPSLKEHLMAQLVLLELGDRERDAAEFIVGNVDDNGYLTCSVDEVIWATGSSPKTAKRALSAVQGLDPAGVGARDLRECLAIQARRAGCSETVLQVIEHHLEDLAGGRYRAIAKKIQVSIQDVVRARDTILRLDPKPGASISQSGITYVYPEVTIRRTQDGALTISVTDGMLPRLRWNSFYRRLLSSGESEAKTYLQEQLRKARNLLRIIEQRRDTIQRVAECIVSRQERFFAYGPGQLEPLTMKEVARDLGVHESTVSRCVRDKYVDTPYGVYPFRAFFTSKVRTDDKDVSQHTVAEIIQRMISSEDPAAPLSDQDISYKLSKQGVHVARRTVAKYRKQLGIKPSGRRKTL